MRRPWIGGNWKMNHGPEQASAFAREFREGIAEMDVNVDIAVFPPYTLLAHLEDAFSCSPACLGAQEMHDQDKGAFTGAVSAAMLIDAGCSHVLIGHSERRQLFGETDDNVNRKIKKAIEVGLIPVLCIGETLDQREAGKTDEVVLSQLEGAFAGIDDPEELVLAYEPVWAIGTGKTATPGQAQEVHAVLRGWLKERFADKADQMRIVYGGSVKPDNVAELMKGQDVDGGLVGGASLKAESFLGIIRNMG